MDHPCTHPHPTRTLYLHQPELLAQHIDIDVYFSGHGNNANQTARLPEHRQHRRRVRGRAAGREQRAIPAGLNVPIGI